MSDATIAAEVAGISLILWMFVACVSEDESDGQTVAFALATVSAIICAASYGAARYYGA